MFYVRLGEHQKNLWGKPLAFSFSKWGILTKIKKRVKLKGVET
jgi:hypothetical protein